METAWLGSEREGEEGDESGSGEEMRRDETRRDASFDEGERGACIDEGTKGEVKDGSRVGYRARANVGERYSTKARERKRRERG